MGRVAWHCTLRDAVGEFILMFRLTIQSVHCPHHVLLLASATHFPILCMQNANGCLVVSNLIELAGARIRERVGTVHMSMARLTTCLAHANVYVYSLCIKNANVRQKCIYDIFSFSGSKWVSLRSTAMHEAQRSFA